jgi:hypothetical protein
MKSLRKYAALSLVLMATLVEAQSPPKPSSAADLRVQAEAIRKDIEADHKHVLHLQALARKEKDVIKLTCINDKLVQLKAQMNLFDTSMLALEGALTTSENSGQTAFAEVEKVGADVKKLRGEADGCAGELEMYKQESRTDVDRPELDDPTDGEPFNPPEVLGEPEIDVPGYATPYR